jgi:hypothetical protein
VCAVGGEHERGKCIRRGSRRERRCQAVCLQFWRLARARSAMPRRGRRERGKAELSVLQEASTSQRATAARPAQPRRGRQERGDASMQLRVLLETTAARPRQKRFKDTGQHASARHKRCRRGRRARGCQAGCVLLEASTSEASAPREAGASGDAKMCVCAVAKMCVCAVGG